MIEFRQEDWRDSYYIFHIKVDNTIVFTMDFSQQHSITIPEATRLTINRIMELLDQDT